MKIGITFDLRGAEPIPAGVPDDLFEEFDDPGVVASIAQVLRGLGHTPIELGNGRPMLEKLLADPPDFVFNFAEGRGISRSREARVPAILETLGIPYTGSDPATLGLCLDKDWTRRMVQSVGVTVPNGITVSFENDAIADPSLLAGVLDDSDLELPLIAKPTFEGSSKGIRNRCVIEKPADFGPVVVELWNAYRQPVLIEEFIVGDELTVGIVGNDPPQVLGTMRMLPRVPSDRFIYGLEVKRDYKNTVDYECPARISEADAAAVEEAALQAFDALGCRDLARIDFRLRDGVPYFLEANPLPGLNPLSGDIVYIANFMGVSHAQLIERILDAAIARTRTK